MKKNSRLYIAGHTGLIGSALLRKYKKSGYMNVITKTKKELDLQNGVSVEKFFQNEKPEYVVLAAAKVGGIKANMTNPAEFLVENLLIFLAVVLIRQD